MRQQSLKHDFFYTIIGDGRMATHFCHYLDLLFIPYWQWSRRLYIGNEMRSETKLTEMVGQSTHVLLLIRDDAIEAFITAHPEIKEKKLVHFSGCLSVDFAYSAHPLMTFGPEKYLLSQYQQIPFIIEKEGPSFAELLPGLSNPNFKIAKAQKAFYHCLCVMANNFTTILWQKCFKEMENKWGIDKQYLFPFLQQTVMNLKIHQQTLTGPLARNDLKTIGMNLAALENDAFYPVYAAFVEAYQKIKQESA